MTHPKPTTETEALAKLRRYIPDHSLASDALDELASALAAAGEREQKGQRVFEAVVYAFEGREVPPDLGDHGMIRRALKYHAKAEAQLTALREAMTTIGEETHVWRSDSLQRIRNISDAALSASPSTGATETCWKCDADAGDGPCEQHREPATPAQLPPAPASAQGAAPPEIHWLDYASDHIRSAIAKAADAPCSADAHVRSALLALQLERIPTVQEWQDSWPLESERNVLLDMIRAYDKAPTLSKVKAGHLCREVVRLFPDGRVVGLRRSAPPAPGPPEETRTEPTVPVSKLRALSEQWKQDGPDAANEAVAKQLFGTAMAIRTRLDCAADLDRLAGETR